MIAIGSDHAGFEYKEYFKKLLSDMGHPYQDFGTFSHIRFGDFNLRNGDWHVDCCE